MGDVDIWRAIKVAFEDGCYCGDVEYVQCGCCKQKDEVAQLQERFDAMAAGLSMVANDTDKYDGALYRLGLMKTSKSAHPNELVELVFPDWLTQAAERHAQRRENDKESK